MSKNNIYHAVSWIVQGFLVQFCGPRATTNDSWAVYTPSQISQYRLIHVWYNSCPFVRLLCQRVHLYHSSSLQMRMAYHNCICLVSSPHLMS